MMPTVTDDRGNRNNEVVVGNRGGKNVEQTSEPVAEVVMEEGSQQPQGKRKQKQQQQGKGKKQKQEQEQDQDQEEEQQKEQGPSKVAQNQAQKIISTVKSYEAPFYVGDVDCEDSVEDVLAVAEFFRTELPNNGCMFISGGTKSFIVAAVVPQEKTSELTATEWVDTAFTVVANSPKATGNDTLAHGVIMADPEKGIFPLKLKDSSRGPTFALLRKKKLIREEKESSDEMYFFDE